MTYDKNIFSYLQMPIIKKEGKVLVCAWFVHCDTGDEILDRYKKYMKFFYCDISINKTTFRKNVLREMFVVHPTILLYFMYDMLNMIPPEEVKSVCEGWHIVLMPPDVTESIPDGFSLVGSREGASTNVSVDLSQEFPIEYRRRFVHDFNGLVDRCLDVIPWGDDFIFGYRAVDVCE